MTRTVVVTDGDERAALALTRALGADGWRVVVTAAGHRSLAGVSRHAARACRTPDPLQAPEAFAAAVGGLAAAEQAALVLPVTEAALLALADHVDALGAARLPWPRASIIRRVLDKAAVLATAEGVGIAVPDQRECAGVPEARAAVRAFGGRVALKPARSVGEAQGERRKVAVALADDVASADVALDAMAAQAWPLLVQRRLVGEGLGVFVLRRNGRVLATFAHRRLREKPPSGGVSVISEAVPRDAALEAQAIALLEALEWDGVAMVEFKRDAAHGGRPTLMEINGRFWGSVQLAVDAGVNFPVLLARAAVGDDVAPVHDWRVGTRLRWTLGDVDHLLIAAKAAARREGWGAAIRTWRAWRGLGRGARTEIGGRGDDAPAWLELGRWLRGR